MSFEFNFVRFQDIGALFQNIGLSEKAVAAFLKVNYLLKNYSLHFSQKIQPEQK